MPISSSPTIRGLVRAADGRPLAGLTVRAFDRDMRAEQELGSPQQPGQTDAEGRFTISYGAQQFARAEKDAADIFFRLFMADGSPLTPFDAALPDGAALELLPVRDGAGKREEIALLRNGATDAEVVLIVRDARLRGPAEYDRYRTELSPLVEQLSLAELSEEDIAFLAGEADIHAAPLASLGDAEGLARTNQIPSAA